MLRVLLVEDESLVRLATAELLRDEGFDVNEASDSNQAAKLLEGTDFDILFTDLRIPGTLDGADLALLARNRRPTIALLFVSGHGEEYQDRLSGFKPEPVLIAKPYSLTEVLAALKWLTRSADMRDEAAPT